jgi:hypothetical protein
MLTKQLQSLLCISTQNEPHNQRLKLVPQDLFPSPLLENITKPTPKTNTLRLITLKPAAKRLESTKIWSMIQKSLLASKCGLCV